MEDATKATARNLYDDLPFEGATEKEGLSAPQAPEPKIPTGEVLHDRWFLVFALSVFGLSMLAWFIHPGLFVLATTGVVLVLYRREFHSDVLEVMLYTDAGQEPPQKGLL